MTRPFRDPVERVCLLLKILILIAGMVLGISIFLFACFLQVSVLHGINIIGI